MRNQFILAAGIVLIFAASFVAQRSLSQPRGEGAENGRPCRRIVAMAPSITEILSALGLDERVVGTSRFGGASTRARRGSPDPAETADRQVSAEPGRPSVAEVARSGDRPQREVGDVGGYLDPNFEAIVSLRPDLVVLLLEQQQAMPAFEKLRLRTLVVSHQDISGILDSIAAIGRYCGAQPRAEELLADIAGRIERIRQQTAGLPRPHVMVTVYRTLGLGRLQNVCIAASDGHLGRIVELAGGENAYRHRTVRFPIVSGEAVLHINPDVIIDLVREESLAALGQETILADWQQVARVAAVKNRRVYVLGDDHAVIPGPDFVSLVERFARLIHPQIAGGSDRSVGGTDSSAIGVP